MLFVELTEAVLLLARMKDSRAPRREFVKVRFWEEIVAVKRTRSAWSIETSPSMARSFVSSTLTTSLVISLTGWI